LIPSFIGSIVIVLYSVVDRYFVGKISEEALAGAGVAFYIIMMFIAFSMLIGVGAGTIISIRLGQKKKAEAEKILGNAIFMFFVVGVALVAILEWKLDFILVYSGANSETLPYARAFLKILIPAVFPMFFSFGMSSILSAQGTPRIAMLSMIIGGVTNMILDYIFIVSMKMGIEGAAIATLIGNTLSSIFVMSFMLFRKLPFTINLFGYKLETKSSLKIRWKYLKPNISIIMSILSVGVAPFLLQFASSFVGLITNRIVDLNGGTAGVAIMTIINSYLPIVTMSVYSISQAAQPIIGFNYGAQNYLRVKKALIISIVMAIILSTFFWIVMMLIPRELILFFNEKSKVDSLREGMKAIRIYFSLIIPASLGIIVPNYFQAVGKPRYSVILNVMRQIVIFLLVVIIFSRIWKLDGVWYAQPFTDFIFTTIVLFVLYKEYKSLNIKIKEASQ
jgi:putative MATE family efflux protein